VSSPSANKSLSTVLSFRQRMDASWKDGVKTTRLDGMVICRPICEDIRKER